MTITQLLRPLSAAALVAATACATPDDGPSMRPGSDCLECHGRGGGANGGEDGPPWTVAGTIYATAQSTGSGVRGAAIHITDANGRQVTLHSQQVGNFYLADGLAFPLKVSIEGSGATKAMQRGVTAADGSCNFCHHAGSTSAGVGGGALHVP